MPQEMATVKIFFLGGALIVQFVLCTLLCGAYHPHL